MNNYQRHEKVGGKRGHSATGRDEEGSPWQAMKRLRVHEGTRSDAFHYQTPLTSHTQTPTFPHSNNIIDHYHQTKQCHEQQRLQESRQQELQSAGQATTSGETNENYAAVNHYLGQLHALRKDRERKQNAAATVAQADLPRTSSPKRGLSEDVNVSQHLRRKVTKLHTNSKLG